MCQHSVTRTSPHPRMRTSQDPGSRRPYPPQQGHQSPKSRKTGHSTGILQQSDENVQRKPASFKMSKGRKSSAPFVFGQGLQQHKVDPADFAGQANGSRSAGPSPTKQFHMAVVEQSNPTVSGQGERNFNSKTCSTPSRSSSPKDGKTTPSRSPIPNLAYAGAKFSDPPSPKVLPKPPTRWFSTEPHLSAKPDNCAEMTNVLKVMLKVQC